MTTTAIDMHRSAALAIRPGQEMWTDKQKAALAVLGIKGATTADLAVFMHYCQKTGLDPFSRQIYGIMRREKQGDHWVDKFTIQVGIDGFRVIRDRVAQRLGVTVEYEDTIWYDAEGGEHKVWLWDEPPAACVVTVVKDGRRFPGAVRFASYAARNASGELVKQWRTQPDHMIEKCAEAFALRRAFPHDLGGVHLEDEMPPQDPAAPARHRGRVTAAEVISRSPAEPPPDETAGDEPAAVPDGDEPGPAAPPENQPGSVSEDQLKQLHTILSGLGFTGEDREAKLVTAEVITGRAPLTGPVRGRSSRNLSWAEAEKLIAKLDEFVNENGERDRAALIAYLATREGGEAA